MITRGFLNNFFKKILSRNQWVRKRRGGSIFPQKLLSQLWVRSSRRFQEQGSQAGSYSHCFQSSYSFSKQVSFKALLECVQGCKDLARHGRLQSISRELCHGNESKEKLMMAHKITIFKKSKSERPHGVGSEYKRAGHDFQLYQVGIHLTHLPFCASTRTLGI